MCRPTWVESAKQERILGDEMDRRQSRNTWEDIVLKARNRRPCAEVFAHWRRKWQLARSNLWMMRRGSCGFSVCYHHASVGRTGRKQCQ